jgi:hypothetical protein
MPTFEKRLVEALDVGAWKLEDEPRESFTATPELHTEIIRLLGAVAEHGVSPCHGAADLYTNEPELAKSVLFTYKSHVQGRFSNQPTRYNEIDVRFKQGLRIQDRKFELISIFHSDNLDLLNYPEFVGGRHIRGWGWGPLGFPINVPEFPEKAPVYDSIEDVIVDAEKLCPATPKGMAEMLSNHYSNI